MTSVVVVTFLLTVAQNAAFTLTSRARNSDSIRYNAMASVVSNGVYLLVFRQIALNLDSTAVLLAYLVGSTLGSVGMHWAALRYFERRRG